MIEIMDLYDKDRQRLNETMVRGCEFKSDRYHLVVHVCIFNQKGEMLIQKRCDDKASWPGKWDISVGGSAVAGDSSRTAAERETFEELGLNLDLGDQRPHLSINFDHGFDDFYLIDKEIDIQSLTFPTIEVETVKWASLDEIFTMIEGDTFMRYKKTFMSMLFEMRGSYGSLDN